MEGDLNTMVQNILQNPEFASLVKELKGDKNENTTVDTDKIMSKLPEMLSMFGITGNGPAITTQPISQGVQNVPLQSINTESLPSAISRFLQPGNKDKRNKLLSALKPYLSPARCTLIDKTMNAMQIGEVLGVMQSAQSVTPPDGKSD